MSAPRQPSANRARERRLRWLVFGGVALGLVVMAVIFVFVGMLAT